MTEKKEHFLKKTFNYALKHSVLFFRFVLVCLIVLYLLSGVFSISSNEIGVHQRFGRIINDKVQPGIHYKLPWPVDKIIKIPVREVKRMVIDDFSISFDRELFPKSSAINFRYMTGLDSYCITGDNNLATIRCVIQYTISNPYEYLFCIKDPDIMLRSLACKTIIHSMARMPIDDILTKGKQSMASYIMFELQRRLDRLKTGINISFVEINNISPPVRVERYFSDVIKASIDREKNINEAESYRNEILPEAKAEAMERIEKAKSYKKEVILMAEGRTERFNKLLERAGERGSSAREYLYIESMKETMENVGSKHIIGNNGDGKPAVKIKIKEKQ